MILEFFRIEQKVCTLRPPIVISQCRLLIQNRDSGLLLYLKASVYNMCREVPNVALFFLLLDDGDLWYQVPIFDMQLLSAG